MATLVEFNPISLLHGMEFLQQPMGPHFSHMNNDNEGLAEEFSAVSDLEQGSWSSESIVQLALLPSWSMSTTFPPVN